MNQWQLLCRTARHHTCSSNVQCAAEGDKTPPMLSKVYYRAVMSEIENKALGASIPVKANVKNQLLKACPDSHRMKPSLDISAGCEYTSKTATKDSS